MFSFFFKENKNENQKGMVCVEVILSLTAFVIFMLGMVNFINILAVHNRIQFAINSAANQIASYSYIYSALGIRTAEGQLKDDFGGAASMDDKAIMGVVDSYNKINTFTGDAKSEFENVKTLNYDSIDSAVDAYNRLKGEGQATIDSLKDTKSKVTACFEDPKKTLAGMIYLATSAGITKVKGLVGAVAAESFTKPFLSIGNASADDYLKMMGVKDGYAGLDFSGSSIFADGDNRMIDIEVRYDVEIGFLGLLMEDPTLSVVQRVTVAGWICGDGDTVEAHIGK